MDHRGSADGGWQRPGLKALSTLSLGIYNNHTYPSTSIFRSKKSFEHTINPFEPIAAENLRFNPDPEHLLECLKVCMMNLGPTQQIPLQQNYAVNVLLETLADTSRDVTAKDEQVEAAKAEAQKAKKHLEEHAEAWNVLETNYKKELRSLEVLVAGGKRGLEYVALARTISDLQNQREEFRKTTPNLSRGTTRGKGDENVSELKKHSEDLQKTTSNLSCGTASGKGDENGSPRQEAKSKIVVSTNQVFNHRRISRPTNDKLFADFGTIMDSELSKTIQQNEDALAGAAKERWLEARRRAGHAGLSSSSGSDEGGLGLTIYDPPMVPSFHAPLPPPIIVEPEGNDNSDEDEGNDDSEELVKIPGGGYMMKPPKKRAAGGRAKSFFGLSKRKVLEFQNSDSSSASSPDSDDRGPRGIARAIASAHFIATIASPMLGIEQATTPPKKTGGLQPPKHTFKNKKTTSYTNLPALAQHFMNGMKKDTSWKSDDSNRPEQPTRLNAKYDKSVAQLHRIVLSEGRAFSKELKPHTNTLPLAHGHEGKENMLHAMSGQESDKSSAGLPSDSVKTATAQRSVSSLRHEYVLDDDDEDNVPTYGKSNSVRGSFEERRKDSNLSSLPRTTSSLGLRVVAQGLTKGDFQMPPLHPQLHPYADGGFATIHSRPIAPDRVYDHRILRKPSPIPFDNGASPSGEGGQRRNTGTNQKVLRDRVKSYKEERDEAEADSRRVLMRASRRKFNDPEPASWDQGQPRRETFHESVIRRQSGAYNGGHGGPSSAVSVVTALYEPRDSVSGDDPDGHLIRGRSERGGISGAYARLTANASSSRKEAGPGRAAEKSAMPYSLSSWALESIRERDEELANSRRIERESMSYVASSIASSHRRRKSTRSKENFLAFLRNAVLPLKSKVGRKAEHPDLPNTVSATSLSGENSKVSKGDAFVIAVPRHPYADPVQTFTSRIESNTSGESPHNRPVTAIFQGLQTSSARRFSFTPPNGRQFSASTKHVVHQSPKNTETPARSWRNPFDGSEKRVYSIETARHSLEISRRKASGLDGRSGSSRPPSSLLAGEWREVGSDKYDSDAPPSRTTTGSLKDTTARRHEVSRESSGAEGSRVDSTAPTTALTYQDSNERLLAPQLPQVQNESSTLRRGGSGQCGRNASRMPSGKSTTSLSKSLVERQATDEQEKPLKIENAKAFQEKPSHAREVHTSSKGSIITVLRQEEPQRPPSPPPKDQHEPTKFHPENSGQYGRMGFRMPSGDSMNSLRQNVTERKAGGEQGEAVKSLAVATKVVGKKTSRDRVVRTSSTGSIILVSEQNQPDRPPPPTKFGSNPNKHHCEDSGQQGKDANTRVPAGSKPLGHMGQRQASGEQKQTVNVAVNPALAAARSVVEAAAKKKLAEEAEKKRK